jgi:hypothetical protein
MSLRTLRTTLRRLGQQYGQAAPPADARDEPRTPADWLAYFVKYSEFMLQRGELDWCDACREFAAAIASGDEPSMDDTQRWLLVMVNRCLEDLPPCTLAEWSELAAWFDVNEERLHEAARANWPDCRLDLGDGRRILPGEIRNAIRMIHPYGGAKAFGSGQTAEDIRRLRERFAARGLNAVTT